nr:amino acid kinase [Candidatus Freyarchaeota archaeon]
MESFDFIVKVGGSLSRSKLSLRKLFEELAAISKNYELLVVPGGGPFADMVRRISYKFNISDDAAHWMAILAMDQMGFFFSDFHPNIRVVDEIEEARQISRGLIPVLIPSKVMFDNDPLPHSWDVTSDSIAAYIAHITSTKRVFILTDVDGVFTSDPKSSPNAELIHEISAEELSYKNMCTSVDKTFPSLVSKYGLECLVLNGRHPERVTQALNNRKVKGTTIYSSTSGRRRINLA